MSKNANPSAYSGLVVQQYRADHGGQRWVFRCWGTDTCDGALSLDHTSEQSAGRALTSHIAEFHQPGSPAPEVEIRITGDLTETQRLEVNRLIDKAARRVTRNGGASQ
ncbi:hypothetical protein ABZX40_13675 [Streptomyces sp. NPDC004610]|uniref:hypothetical protein n=1 Tax=unclassified Streptomyces TaxID=2593676 RepID=UPI00339DB9F3